MQEVVKSWFCMFCSQQWSAQLLYVSAECMYDMLFDLEFEATTSASVTSVSSGSNLLHLSPHGCILQLAVTPATLQQLSAQQHFHISLVDMCLCHQY